MKKYFLSSNYTEDEVSKRLIDYLDNQFRIVEGYIYYGFPTIKELDSPPIAPNVLVVMKNYGVFAFVCSDITEDRNRQLSDLKEIGNTIDTHIFSRLIKNKDFCLDSRTLKFNFEVIYYFPNFNSKDSFVFDELTEIKKYIDSKYKQESGLDANMLENILAVLESSSAMIKPQDRIIDEKNSNSKALVLQKLESNIAKFDDVQRLAALSVLDGPQRIRGLAGTGKTIILCLKAAKLHYENPGKKILYTFYTKSLYDYIRQLITRFYIKLSEGFVPDFDNCVLIRHAWGGKNLNGVYYDTCISNDVSPMKLSNVKNIPDDNYFDYVCKELLLETNGKLKREYDYLLIDEAQDFLPSFYQLCRQIVKDDHIIWCYDELQNIFNVKLQNPLKTFQNKELNISGINLKALSKRNPEISNDIVLPKSYRNLKEILVTAHAIGFGIYNDTLVQSLENNEHWEDLGYEVVSGDCSKEENVIIRRIDENSPLKLPLNYNNDDIIVIKSADNIIEETDWVSIQIIKCIKDEGLNPDDIVIITFDDKNSHMYADLIARKLEKEKIELNSIVDRNYVKGFTKKDSVTFSTVYKAKGNEAAMVFVVGCNLFDEDKNSRATRNKIFTSFTRAKVWLRISGIDIKNSQLVKEIKMIKENNYELKFFNKPTTILQRDWDETSKRIELKNDLWAEIKKKAQESGIDLKELIDEYGSK